MKNAGILCEMGYGLQLLHVPRVVSLCDNEKVITATYSDSGMPYVGLSNIRMLYTCRMRCCCQIKLIAILWNCYIFVVVMSVVVGGISSCAVY